MLWKEGGTKTISTFPQYAVERYGESKHAMGGGKRKSRAFAGERLGGGN